MAPAPVPTQTITSRSPRLRTPESSAMRPTRTAPLVAAALLAAPLTALPLTSASAAAGPGSSPHGKLATREMQQQLADATKTPAATEGPRTAAAAATAAALDCAAYSSDGVTYLADRNVFKIAQVGASSVTIDRQRYGGAQVRLVTDLTGTRAEFADTRISRASRPVYTLAFTFADGTSKTCTTEDAMLHNEDIVVGTEEGKIGAMGFGTNPSSLATRDSFAPAYSPDGRWLGYSAPGAKGGLDIYVRRADGTGGGVALPSTGGDDVEVAFSFDGRYAVYSSYGEVDSRLKLLDLNTGALRDVPNSADLSEAVWTTDGRLLATDYSSDLAPVVYIHPATGVRAGLAGSAGGWSPDTAADGTIAYATFNETSGSVEVRLVRGGTTSVTEVLPTESYGYSVRLAASKTDRVLFIESTATFDETTGDLIDFISTVKSDDIAAGNAAESVEGSDPMAMPSWLDVRAPLSTGTSDFTGDRLNDMLARDKDGVLWVYRGQEVVNSNVTLGNRVRVGGGWSTMSTFVAAGDMNSDGRADVLARDTSGVLWLYPGTGRLSPVLGTRVRVGGGWGGYVIVTGGDFNGDLSADILARDTAGYLWLYPGTGTGGQGASALNARKLVGKGWNGMNALVAVGDATGDGTPDLYARDRSTNLAYLYPGSGTGTLGTRRSLGYSWGQNAYAGIENHSTENDSVAILGRHPDGGLFAEWFRGDGSIDTGTVPISQGWGGYTITG